MHCRWVVSAFLALVGSAPAAAAAPIFGSGSASPDAVSPNGDGVQEFAVISYDILPDSADVRILIADAGTGAAVDTLRRNSRQGSGPRSLLFDGTGVGGAPVPDGEYLVQILGVGTGGEGVEQLDIPLRIDRAAPVITELSTVSPLDGVATNGATITVQVCVDGDPDTVRADFGALDSGFASGAVTETLIPPSCRRFTYTITPGNTVSDAEGLPVRVTALDRAGNRTTAEIPFCLSNTPPLRTGSFIVGFPDSIPIFRNGDIFQIEAGFSSPMPLSVTADFSGLDTRFDPDSVRVDDLGGGRFRLEYGIDPANAAPDGTYPLTITARDTGCGSVVDDSLVVVLDNAGAFDALIANVSVDPPAFSPNGDGVQDEVRIRFSVIEDTVTVAVNATVRINVPPDSVQVPILPFTQLTRGTYEYVWDGNVGRPAETVVDQVVSILVRGIVFTPPDGLRRDVFVPVEIDKTPPVLTGFSDFSSRPFRNGNRVDLGISYDRAGYTLAPEFGALDSGFQPAAVAVVDSGNGDYGIFYSISAANIRPDGNNIDVPVTATDAAGNSLRTEGLLRLCLSNQPPRLVSTELITGTAPYRNGDRLEFFVRWLDVFLPASLEVDLSLVDSEFDPDDVTVIDRTLAGSDTAVFQVAYDISSSNEIDVGNDLPVFVTVVDDPDRGCGRTTVQALEIDIDSIRPEIPSLEAASLVVRTPFVLLFGRALDAIEVRILTDDTPVDTLSVNPADGTYAGEVGLVPGENRFRAEAIDAAGNVSRPSPEIRVFFVSGAFLEIPGPFRPGNAFFLGLVEPAASLTLHIFNLDGVEIARLEQGPGDLYTIPWNGRDHHGRTVSSGPYVVVADITLAGGGKERIRRALLFSRRGP